MDRRRKAFATGGKRQDLRIVARRMSPQDAQSGVLARLYGRLTGYLDSPEAWHILFNTTTKLAFINDRSYAIGHFRAKGLCNWYMVPETFYTSGLATALPNHSPFEPVFSEQWVRFPETMLLFLLVFSVLVGPAFLKLHGFVYTILLLTVVRLWQFLASFFKISERNLDFRA